MWSRGLCIDALSVSQLNPGRGVVTGFFAAAVVFVDACTD
jgi:hypothetical protein